MVNNGVGVGIIKNAETLGFTIASVKSCQLLLLATVIVVTCVTGCNRAPDNPAAALVGHYRLQIGRDSNCSGRGIESSTLDLRDDGTAEQQDNFKDGSKFTTRGTWYVDSATKLQIEKLRITTTGEIDKNASPLHASPIVQWSGKPNIILSPDDSCLFSKD